MLRMEDSLFLRNLLSASTSFLLAAFLTPLAIRYLLKYQVSQSIRINGPDAHLSKSGTPTMGGLILLGSLLLSALVWSDLSNQYACALLFLILVFASVGLIDDYLKISRRKSEGLSAKNKFFLQSIPAILFASFFYFMVPDPVRSHLFIPLLDISSSLPLGGFSVVLSYFVIVGSSNAVNLTDGLDGLAIVPIILVSTALGIFCYLSGSQSLADTFAIPYTPGTSELTILCSALLGAGLAFLWFNAYPARIFMGDVGSLALGALIGGIAIIVRQEILLFFMGGVFVIETLSVFMQVTYFKLTRRRIFRMAPIHHHFELGGHSETQITVRFWIITFILVIIGISTLLLR